jgi:hypothetical protein
MSAGFKINRGIALCNDNPIDFCVDTRAVYLYPKMVTALQDHGRRLLLVNDMLWRGYALGINVIREYLREREFKR